MGWEEEVEPGAGGGKGFYEQGDHLGDVGGSGVAKVNRVNVEGRHCGARLKRLMQ